MSGRTTHEPPPEDRCEHAEELAQLRAGEDLTPRGPGCEPTPGQWLRKFNEASPEQRLAWAADIIRHARQVSACEFLEDHRGQIEEYRSQIQRYQTLADVAAGTKRGLYLVDIDGTLALRPDVPGVRGPFEWDRVGEDHPNAPVIAVVQALAAAGHRIIYLSGRSGECRAATGTWIAEHVGVPGESLLMRTAGDRRPDEVVKRELYERWVKAIGDVTAVLDDRNKVVAMWRELGLTVFQVADGDF